MILTLLVGRGVRFVVNYGIRTEQNTNSRYREGTIVNNVIAKKKSFYCYCSRLHKSVEVESLLEQFQGKYCN